MLTDSRTFGPKSYGSGSGLITLLPTQLRAANVSIFFYCQVLALGMPIIPPQELGFLGSLTACMPSSSLNFMPAYVSCCMIPTKRFIHNYLTPATLPDIFRWLWFLRTYKVGKDVWSHLLEFLHALRNEFLKIGTVPSDFHIHKLCIT